jgi:hypothetical protein
MKLYGKRRIMRNVDKRAQLKVPDRDAIIWSVDLNNHYALVKVQGSNETIKAHFPKNWFENPYWLKPGNAVRVRHRAGNRGYIEIIGEGRAIPSPVAGGTFPTLQTLPNGVLTGMAVTETSPVPTMAVAVASGTYRINGVVYSFAAESTESPLMQVPPVMTMTDPPLATMGEGDHVIAIDPAPVSSGYARYDILVIGTDGVIDYIKGSEATLTAGPTVPTTPSNHVLLATIFVQYGMTVITNADIGQEWTEPALAYLSYTCGCSDCELAYSLVTDYPTCTVTLSARDQYGVARNYAGGATVEITMVGTGTFKGTQDGDYHDQGTKGYSTMVGSGCSFVYKRDQTEPVEQSPFFVVRVIGWGMLQTTFGIVLGNSP